MSEETTEADLRAVVERAVENWRTGNHGDIADAVVAAVLPLLAVRDGEIEALRADCARVETFGADLAVRLHAAKAQVEADTRQMRRMGVELDRHVALRAEATRERDAALERLGAVDYAARRALGETASSGLTEDLVDELATRCARMREERDAQGRTLDSAWRVLRAALGEVEDGELAGTSVADAAEALVARFHTVTNDRDRLQKQVFEVVDAADAPRLGDLGASEDDYPELRAALRRVPSELSRGRHHLNEFMDRAHALVVPLLAEKDTELVALRAREREITDAHDADYACLTGTYQTLRKALGSAADDVGPYLLKGIPAMVTLLADDRDALARRLADSDRERAALAARLEERRRAFDDAVTVTPQFRTYEQFRELYGIRGSVTGRLGGPAPVGTVAPYVSGPDADVAGLRRDLALERTRTVSARSLAEHAVGSLIRVYDAFRTEKGGSDGTFVTAGVAHEVHLERCRDAKRWRRMLREIYSYGEEATDD